MVFQSRLTSYHTRSQHTLAPYQDIHRILRIAHHHLLPPHLTQRHRFVG